MNTLRVLLFLALLTLTAAPLQAAGLVSANDVTVLLNIAKGFGSADMDTDERGDPMITGRIEGVRYNLLLYGCDSNHRNCKDIQFAAAWTGYEISSADANRWNRDHRVGRCYVETDGKVRFDVWANLRHGVSRDNLEDTFDWWRTVLGEFNSFIQNN